MRPITLTGLKALALKLYSWTDEKDGLNMGEFFHFAGVTKSNFYKFVELCPELKEAYEYTLDVIGSRRESGAMRKKLDTTAVWKCQYQYGSQYREAVEFAAQLAKKEQEQQSSVNITVKMDKVESDDKYFKKEK